MTAVPSDGLTPNAADATGERQRNGTNRLTRGAIAVAVLCLLLAIAGRTSASADGQTPPTPAPAGQPAATAGAYAGQDTCLTCHTDQTYEGTAHARPFSDRTPAANQGCESCHGPGKAHADA
ncbi:MAG TPA: multiheme c-type cytochrome, partial [Vicinamibacterales bacterium]|nr:multiheme c-type cytochrome [Vicinamibacterales bacterium]